MAHRISILLKGIGISLISLFLFSFDHCISLFMKKPYKGKHSDHFNGRHFFNPHVSKRRFIDFLIWTMIRKPVPWPKEKIMNKKYPLPPAFYPPPNGMLTTFVNHSTVLIQWDKWNILTDPIWMERCSPFKYIGPKRMHQPGVPLENLPPIHLILLSHNHYDHLDLKTLKFIANKFHPLIATGLGVKSLLDKHHIPNVVELDWWQECAISENFTITFTPAQHFSSRRLGDRDLTLWGSFFLRGVGASLYFAGDTGYGPHFKEVRERCGSPSLALIPIGIYEPRWFMESVHMSPVEAVQAHLDLDSKQSLGIHFGTFGLADEGLHDPPKLLKETLRKRQLSDEVFWVLKPGESKSLKV